MRRSRKNKKELEEVKKRLEEVKILEEVKGPEGRNSVFKFNFKK